MLAVRLSAPLLVIAVVGFVSGVQSGSFSHCTELGRCYQECDLSGNKACDTLPALPYDALNGEILYYSTAQNGDKFAQYQTKWQASKNESSSVMNVEINVNKSYQSILGFGGAITDASIINLNKVAAVSETVMNDILTAYYSVDSGSGYTTSRVPMASCDFSPYSYTYAPVENDFALNHFNLTVQDFGNDTFYGRISVIQRMQQIMLMNKDENHDLFLFATPWTPPFWMKDNNAYIQGRIIQNKTYLESYANYFVKYLSAYQTYGNITFSAVTPQNEPHSPSPFESCTWETRELSDFVANYLGPKIKAFDPMVSIWVHDGQKGILPEEGYDYFLSDAKNFINGVAFHWYLTPPPVPGCELVCTGAFESIDAMHEFVNDENVIFVGTEACTGFDDIESPPNRGVSLGNMNRGQQYAEDIIGDLNVNASSWNDWNIALDVTGGPNHVGNVVDAPIIIDVDKNVYYKQPMYYYLAHITRYVRPRSRRVYIGSTDNNKNEDVVWYTAFVDTQVLQKTVIVVVNTDDSKTIAVQLHDARFGYMLIELPPKSIQTVLYDN